MSVACGLNRSEGTWTHQHKKPPRLRLGCEPHNLHDLFCPVLLWWIFKSHDLTTAATTSHLKSDENYVCSNCDVFIWLLPRPLPLFDRTGTSHSEPPPPLVDLCANQHNHNRPAIRLDGRCGGYERHRHQHERRHEQQEEKESSKGQEAHDERW